MSNREVKINPVFNIDTIKINVSNTCNMACKYCYANEGNYGEKDCIMSIDTAKDICFFIEENFPNVKKFIFFGGEPLLNIDAIELICNHFKEKNIMYGLVTNLTILNDRVKSVLTNNDISITVSLDGPKLIHDMNRVFKNNAPSYDIVSNNIKELQKHSKINMVEVTCTSKLEKLYSFNEIKKFIYDEFNIKNILIVDVSTEIEELKLDQNYFFKKFNSVDQRVEDFFSCILDDDSCLEVNEIFSCVLSLFANNITKSPCNAGMRSLLIDANGEIWPCQAYINDKRYSYGNIYLNNFKPQVNEYVIEYYKKSLIKCDSCISRYWCNQCFFDKNNSMLNKCTFNNKISEEVIKNVIRLVENNQLNLLNSKISERYSNEK